MSDSDDSDYVVEDFVQPETVRHTYTKEEDVISGSDEEQSGESENEDVSSKNAQREGENVEEEKIEEPEEEPPRPNSRFILYVTNLSGETTRSMIQDYFGDCGEIKSIRIPKVRLGCYAFVEMKDFSGFKVRFLTNSIQNVSNVFFFFLRTV